MDGLIGELLIALPIVSMVNSSIVYGITNLSVSFVCGKQGNHASDVAKYSGIHSTWLCFGKAFFISEIKSNSSEISMEIWAKLFESNGRQVLLTKEYNDDDNPKVSIAVRIDGYQYEAGPVFKGEKAEEFRDKFFDAANQDTADRLTGNLIDCKNIEEALEALTEATHQ